MCSLCLIHGVFFIVILQICQIYQVTNREFSYTEYSTEWGSLIKNRRPFSRKLLVFYNSIIIYPKNFTICIQFLRVSLSKLIFHIHRVRKSLFKKFGNYILSNFNFRRGCGLAEFNNRLYIVGGSDGTHSLSSTEYYDEETKTWTAGPNLTISRANVSVVVVGERLYAIGGFSGKTFLNTIEYLDQNSNEWTTFVQQNSAITTNTSKSTPSQADYHTYDNKQIVISDGGNSFHKLENIDSEYETNSIKYGAVKKHSNGHTNNHHKSMISNNIEDVNSIKNIVEHNESKTNLNAEHNKIQNGS